MILSEKLYLAEDRKTVVKDGDKRAAFLLGVAGSRISDPVAKKLGLLDEPEVIINAIETRDPEITVNDPEPTNRDGGQPKRRGRPPKSLAG